MTTTGVPARAVVVSLDGRVDLVMLVEVSGDRITSLYLIRNPEKLARVGQTAPIGR